MLFPLTSPFCALLTGEDPAWVQEHSYVTPGIGRIQRGKAGPYFCHLLFSAQLGSQPARHPTRERGGGGGWGGSRSCRNLAEPRVCSSVRARAEGVGRAARAPRRPQALFPHLALPLRSLFPACGSQIHVCKSARARVCVCVCVRVCSRETVCLGSDRPGGRRGRRPARQWLRFFPPPVLPSPFLWFPWVVGTSSHSPSLAAPISPMEETRASR